MPDFVSTNLGRIIILAPRTSDAEAWMLENLGTDMSVPVEHGYFADIAYGLLAEGYTLQDAETGRYAHA